MYPHPVINWKTICILLSTTPYNLCLTFLPNPLGFEMSSSIAPHTLNQQPPLFLVIWGTDNLVAFLILVLVVAELVVVELVWGAVVVDYLNILDSVETWRDLSFWCKSITRWLGVEMYLSNVLELLEVVLKNAMACFICVLNFFYEIVIYIYIGCDMLLRYMRKLFCLLHILPKLFNNFF